MARLTDLTVQWISLVKRPANGRGTILKAADSRGQPIALSKADAKLNRLYGIVYAPDSVDAHGDWADAETIRRAADAFMRDGRSQAVDVEHGFEPVPAFVAESWLVRAGDPLFPGEKAGAWAVGIQIEDAALWAAIEAGEVGGLSLAGTARLAKRSWFDRFFNQSAKEQEMTHDDVRAIVREVLDETVRKAEAEEEAEALKKSIDEKAKQIERLEKAIAEKDAQLTELERRIGAIEATGKGAAEGDAGGDASAASFV